MIFTPTKLPGACIIDLDRREDERGFFARAWCQREFEEHGLCARLVQANLSHNRKRGTLRGMHFQRPPWEETKLVRCTRGALWDAIIDLRPDSPTRGQWIGVTLSAENGRMLLVPEGFAHGYITLEDDTDALYQVSQFYAPNSEGGIRWNDPQFGIEWPIQPDLISDKDSRWPDYAGVDPAVSGASDKAG